MGFGLWWIGVRGKAPETVLAELGLRRTGKAWDLPDRNVPFCWAQRDGGWTLALGSARSEAAPAGAFLDGSDEADRILAALSAGCELVCCAVEENAMVSRASAWRDGARQWSAWHDPAAGGVEHLVLEGTPPAAWPDIEAGLRAEQAGEADGEVDLLVEAPLELARSVVGFRHDEDELVTEVLEAVRPPAGRPPERRSWLDRLLER